MSNYSVREALDFAISGKFPQDFDQWEMEDTTAGAERKGWTITHEIVRHHDLPEGLERLLTLPTKDGTTVAHVIAFYGVLPEGFSDWALADHSGWTVAHTAACSCVLPEDFNQWDLATPEGYTVAQASAFGQAMARLEESGGLDMADAGIRNSIGYTVAHFAAQGDFLPDDFDQWDLADPEGWTVAHEAVSHGTLPRNFNRWDLTACNGETVANIAAFRGTLPADFDRWDLVSEEYRREGWISQISAAPKIGM